MDVERKEKRMIEIILKIITAVIMTVMVYALNAVIRHAVITIIAHTAGGN